MAGAAVAVAVAGKEAGEEAGVREDVAGEDVVGMLAPARIKGNMSGRKRSTSGRSMPPRADSCQDRSARMWGPRAVSRRGRSGRSTVQIVWIHRRAVATNMLQSSKGRSRPQHRASQTAQSPSAARPNSTSS